MDIRWLLCIAFCTIILIENGVEARRKHRHRHSHKSRRRPVLNRGSYEEDSSDSDSANADDGYGDFGRGVQNPIRKPGNKRQLGTKKPMHRIVGGTDAIPYMFPSIVSIEHDKETICGGAIVKPNWVMTAAHCVFDYTIDKYILTAGEHKRSVKEGFEQKRRVVKGIPHPKYNPKDNTFDIGLLKVSPAFNLNDKVQVARLPPKKDFPVDSVVTVVGWGATKEDADKGADVLQVVYLPTISDLECQKKYKDDNILDNQLCTLKAKGGADACQGDSGSPVYSDTKNPTVVAVASWGEGCARPNHPGVYTEVSHFLSWIKKNTGNNN